MNIVRHRCSWPPPDSIDFSVHNLPSKSSSDLPSTDAAAKDSDILSTTSNSASSTFSVLPLATPSDRAALFSATHYNRPAHKRRKANVFQWPAEDAEDIRFIVNYKGQCEILEFSSQWEFVDVQQATLAAARKARPKDKSREKQSSSSIHNASLILDDNGRPHNTRNRAPTSKSPMLTASSAVPLKPSSLANSSPKPERRSRFKRDVNVARSQSPTGAVPMRRSGSKAASEMGVGLAPKAVPGNSSFKAAATSISVVDLAQTSVSSTTLPTIIEMSNPLLLQPTRVTSILTSQPAISIPPTMAGYDNLPKSMSPQSSLIPLPNSLPPMQIPSVFQQSPISSTFIATLAPEPSSTGDDLYTSDAPQSRTKSPAPSLADQKRTRSTRKAFPGEMTILIPNPTQTAAFVNVRTTKRDRSA